MKAIVFTLAAMACTMAGVIVWRDLQKPSAPVSRNPAPQWNVQVSDRNTGEIKSTMQSWRMEDDTHVCYYFLQTFRDNYMPAASCTRK